MTIRLGLLGGWLAIAMLMCVVAFSMGSRGVAAAPAALLDCVGSTNGTPEPTPPSEEPTSVAGSGGSNGLPCPTITPTIGSAPPPLPGGFGGGAGSGPNGGSFPSYGGGANGANGSGGNGGAGGSGSNATGSNGPSASGSASGTGSSGSCSGIGCFFQSAKNSVGHLLSQAGNFWNSQSTLGKVLIVLGAVVVVVAVVALVIFAAPILAAAGGAIAGIGEAIAASDAAISISTFIAENWWARGLITGAVNGITTVLFDHFIDGQNWSSSLQDGAVWFAASFVGYGVGIRFAKWLGTAGRLTWVQRMFAPLMRSDEWFFNITKVHLVGPGVRRIARWLAMTASAAAVIWGVVGLEALNATVLHNALHLPPPDLLQASIDTVVLGIAFLAGPETAPTIERTIIRGLVKENVEGSENELLGHLVKKNITEAQKARESLMSNPSPQ